MKTHHAESIITSWSKDHSNEESNVSSVKEYHSSLPLIDAPVHISASQYHCMNIITKTNDSFNPGQIVVCVCDQPVSDLQRRYKTEILKKFDQISISI